MTTWICDHLNDDYQAHVLHHLHRLEQLAMTESAAQAAVDADVTSLTTSEQSIAASFAELLLEFKSNNPGVDTAKLDAFTAQLVSDATTDSAEVAPVSPAPSDPTPVAPAPTTPDAPADPTPTA